MTTSTLPAPAYKTVSIAGVEVEMFEDWKPSRIDPMKVPLSYWADSEDFTMEEITRLHLAGIDSLPVYQSELEARGTKWEEVE